MNRSRDDLAENSRPTLTDVVTAADFLDAGFVKQSLQEIDWNGKPVALKNLNLDEKTSERLMLETRQEIAQILKVIA